jgi:beta-xylosidase
VHTTPADFASGTSVFLDYWSVAGAILLDKPCDDQFNTSLLQAKWSFRNQPSSYDVNTSVPGHLNMTSTQGNDFWGGTSTGHLLYQNISGNFTVEAKLSSTPTTQYQRGGLMVMQDSDDWVELSYGRSAGGNAVLTISNAAGNPTSNAVGVRDRKSVV